MFIMRRLGERYWSSRGGMKLAETVKLCKYSNFLTRVISPLKHLDLRTFPAVYFVTSVMLPERRFPRDVNISTHVNIHLYSISYT